MRKFKTVLNHIAEENGVSTKNVLCEIEKVIDIGLNSPDPKVRKQWETIPHKGNRLSPEDVVNYLAVMTTMQRNAEKPAFIS